MSGRRFHSDWNCSHCNFRNFSSRTSCKNCVHGKKPINNNNKPRKGDWNCTRCNFLNFKSRHQCKNCNTPKTNTPKQKGKKGDWNCAKCNFLNFKSRNICKKCGNSYKSLHVITHTKNKNVTKCDASKPETPKAINNKFNMDQKTNDNISDIGPGAIESTKIEESNKERAIYKKLVKKKREYDETVKAIQIKIAIGKIINLMISTIGAYASGGVLLPSLCGQLKDAIVNVSWSTSNTKKKITEHFFENDSYLFIEIGRNVEQSSKGIGPFKRKKINIQIELKFIYVEAGNDLAKQELQKMSQQQATTAFNYINNL
eukprot:135174_1